jgi:adenylate kinase
MNFIFMGKPGSGKGTQGRILARHKLVHLATGDMLRKAKEEGTPAGKLYAQLCANGGLAPDSLMIDIIRERFTALLTRPFSGYILDGFPRTEEQVRAFDDIVRMDPRLTIDLVAEFRLDDQGAHERMTSRWQCVCGEVYGLIRQPPDDTHCVECGRGLYQRDEDRHEAAWRRIELYHTMTEPALAVYRSRGIVHTIDATLPPEIITKTLLNLMISESTRKYATPEKNAHPPVVDAP